MDWKFDTITRTGEKVLAKKLRCERGGLGIQDKGETQIKCEKDMGKVTIGWANETNGKGIRDQGETEIQAQKL